MGRRKQGDRVWFRRRSDGRGWRVISVVDGARTSSTVSTEQEARRLTDVLRAHIDARSTDMPITWEDGIEAFTRHRARQGDRPSTLTTYRHWLGAVGRTLGSPDPCRVTERDAFRHMDARREAGISPTTIRSELDAVTSLQRWMHERGWVPCVAWAKVKRPDRVSTRRKHLDPLDVGRFLRAAIRLGSEPPEGARARDWERWPAAVWLLLHGLRTGEAQRLRVGDLDLVGGVVYVVDREGARTKTAASERAVPVMSAQALGCLRETFKHLEPDAPAFRTGKGEAAARGRTKWFALRARVTCEAAGIRHISPHGLRHSIATAAVVAGADMHSLQSMLGHSDARVTANVYSHATSAQRAAGASRLVGDWLDRMATPSPDLKVV